MEDKGNKSQRPAKPKTIDLEARDVVRDAAAQVRAGMNAATTVSGDKTADVVFAAETADDELPADEAAMAHPGLASPAAQSETGGTRGSRSRLLGTIGAAMFGSVISLAALAALDSTGLLQSMPGLNSLLGKQQATAPVPQTSGLEAEFETLRQKLAALEASQALAGAGSLPDERTASLESRLAAAETETRALRQSIASGLPPSALADTATSKLAELAARLEITEKAITVMQAEKSANNGTPADITGLSSKLQSEIAALTTARSGDAAKLASLEQRIVSLEASAAMLAKAGEQQANAGKAAALLLSANALKSAIENGQSIAGLLDPIAALTGRVAALDNLQGLAKAGLMSNAALLSQFELAARSMSQPTEPAGQGVFGDLIANAKALVQVLPDGPVEGNAPQAIASRIRAALQSGDLGSAESLWSELPEAAKTVSAHWHANLLAKINALASLDELLRDLGNAGGG